MFKNILLIATSTASSVLVAFVFLSRCNHTFMLANVVLLRLEWCDSVCCCFSLLQHHHILCCKQVWNPKSKDEHQPSFFSSPLPFHLKSASIFAIPVANAIQQNRSVLCTSEIIIDCSTWWRLELKTRRCFHSWEHFIRSHWTQGIQNE